MTSADGSSQTCKEISDLNLSYLLLAQQLLRDDRPGGMVRLGISEEVAGLLLGMSLSDTVRMATSNFVLCALRLEDDSVVQMLRGSRASALQQAHVSIVLASSRVRELRMAA